MVGPHEWVAPAPALKEKENDVTVSTTPANCLLPQGSRPGPEARPEHQK